MPRSPSHIRASVHKSVQKWGGLGGIPELRFRSSRARMALEHFRVDPSNRLAFLAIKALLAPQPVPWRCVYLYGPAGCGKTHLISGMARAWKDRSRRALMVITGEQFIRAYRASFRSARMAQFHQTIEHAGTLALDDVERLRNAPSAQRELARACDALLQRGGMVLFTGREQPYRLRLEERLQDRIASGLVLAMGLAVPSVLRAAAT